MTIDIEVFDNYIKSVLSTKWIETNLGKYHTKSLKTYYLTDYIIITIKKMNCVNCNTIIDKKAPLQKC